MGFKLGLMSLLIVGSRLLCFLVLIQRDEPPITLPGQAGILLYVSTNPTRPSVCPGLAHRTNPASLEQDTALPLH